MMRRIDPPVAGAWMLLLFRPEGLDQFVADRAHFRLSWMAVALAAPFVLLGVLAQNRFLVEEGRAAVPLWMGLGAFVVYWAITSLIVVLAIALSGRPKAALPILMVYNWVQLVLVVATTPIDVIGGFGLVPAGVALVMTLVGLLFSIAVKAHMLWRMLGGEAWPVVGAIVGGEVAVGLLIGLFTA